MKKISLTLVLLAMCFAAQAQVGIGTTTPDASSALDVVSTSKGFLPPRLTTSERDAILSPASGLIIFCSDCGGAEGQPQYYSGSSWISMIKSTAVLNGTSNPSDITGENGDFFINTLSLEIFGPKVSGTWPTGVSLVGPQGNDGMPGWDGMAGADGQPGPQGDPGLLPDNGIGQNIGSMPFWDGGNWNLNSNIYNVVFNDDTFVGIGNQFPGHALDVSGTVNATSFIGDGSLLTNISVSEFNILDDSITWTKLANGSVISDKLAYGSVTSDKIDVGSITSDKLSNNSVTTIAIADESVTGAKLQDNVVTNSKLAWESVGSSNIIDNTIEEWDINNGSISSSKIKVPQNNFPNMGSLLRMGTYDLEWQSPLDILVDLETDQTISGSKSFQDNVRVGTTTVTDSAALEIASTVQGFLPPRMTSTQRDAIVSPVTGLIVFCTNCGSVGQPQFYSGTTWYNMLGEAAAAPQP